MGFHLCTGDDGPSMLDVAKPILDRLLSSMDTVSLLRSVSSSFSLRRVIDVRAQEHGGSIGEDATLGLKRVRLTLKRLEHYMGAAVAVFASLTTLRGVAFPIDGVACVHEWRLSRQASLDNAQSFLTCATKVERAIHNLKESRAKASFEGLFLGDFFGDGSITRIGFRGSTTGEVTETFLTSDVDSLDEQISRIPLLSHAANRLDEVFGAVVKSITLAAKSYEISVTAAGNVEAAAKLKIPDVVKNFGNVSAFEEDIADVRSNTVDIDKKQLKQTNLELLFCMYSDLKLQRQVPASEMLRDIFSGLFTTIPDALPGLEVLTIMLSLQVQAHALLCCIASFVALFKNSLSIFGKHDVAGPVKGSLNALDSYLCKLRACLKQAVHHQGLAEMPADEQQPEWVLGTIKVEAFLEAAQEFRTITQRHLLAHRLEHLHREWASLRVTVPDYESYVGKKYHARLAKKHIAMCESNQYISDSWTALASAMTSLTKQHKDYGLKPTVMKEDPDFTGEMETCLSAFKYIKKYLLVVSGVNAIEVLKGELATSQARSLMAPAKKDALPTCMVPLLQHGSRET